MPTLYIITGPAGVGKSTISKSLSQRLNRSVLIEGDLIYHQVVGGYVKAWKEGNHLSTFWKVCINMMENYLSDGFDVVFNYIVTKDELENIKNKLKDYRIKFVVLITDEKTLLSRDKERLPDNQMGERCTILLNNFKNSNYPKKYFLDTTNLSVSETTSIIENENEFIL